MVFAFRDGSCEQTLHRHVEVNSGKAPLYIWGDRVVVACKFFLHPQENNFFGNERPTIFFMFRRRNKISLFCRMPSLLCRLPFRGFSGQHLFHQFRQQTFLFSDHIPNKLLFLTFVSTNFFFIFFLAAPPPQISNGASLTAFYSSKQVLLFQ